MYVARDAASLGRTKPKAFDIFERQFITAPVGFHNAAIGVLAGSEQKVAEFMGDRVAEQCGCLRASRDLYDAVIEDASVVGKLRATRNGRESQSVYVCLPARHTCGKDMQEQL